VQREVDEAADQYSKDAAPDTALNDLAAAFIKDSRAIASGAQAAQAMVDAPGSTMLPPGDLQQLSTTLKAVSAYAGQLAAQQPATDDCENMARAFDALVNLLAFGAAANKSQDQVLDDIKNVTSSANGAEQAGQMASGTIRALAQAHVAEADINSFLIQNTMEAERAAFQEKCTSLAGPLSGTMTAHFYTKQGAEWWTYSYRIHGFIRLHASHTLTAPVPVEGEIFGYGDDFTYESDPYSAAYQKIVIGATIDNRAPAGDSSRPSYGGAQLSPVGFVTNVVGTITGDRVDLKLGDATKDFDPSYAVGTTNATVIPRQSPGMPQKNHYTLPYKNARWVLDQFFSHGLTLNLQHNKSPDINYVVYSVTRTRPANQNSADYSLALSACDPNCIGQ
jgi:hypothetical protein